METDEKKLCERIFALAGKREAEVLIFSSESALTRFADNIVSQNVANRSQEIVIRLLEGGRMGRVSLNHSGDDELRTAVASAEAILKSQKPDPDLLPLAEPREVRPNDKLYDAETAGYAPASRADRLEELVDACKGAGQLASGTLDNGWSRVTVANSKGVFASHRETAATFSVTVKDGDGLGWAEEFQPRVKSLDFAAVGVRAREKAKLARSPKKAEPGRYTVVLEPNPVANLLLFTGIYGFGGQFFLEDQSFVSSKLGTKVLGDNITLEDNGLDGLGASMPFDFEGMPRTKVTLVEKGVAKAVVHDRKTAKKSGLTTTGHALPVPNTYGPFPTCVGLMGGDSSYEDLIKGTKKGVLVTQFHYVNVLKPKTLELTGMTRNGTYMIEDGKIAYPIKNFRFTESMVDAFGRVDALAKDRELTEAFFGGKFVVPALKMRDFNFSSTTEF